ncbi:MAG: DUF3379 family protein [Pseudomonadota bacterium]
MNCLEFRRLLLIEPCSSDDDFVAHHAKCTDCRHEAAQTEQLENQLREMLSVDPPEGLRDRIMLEHALEYGKSRHGIRTRWVAMAASLLLVVGLMGGLGYHWADTLFRASGLEVAVLNHVNDELDHLHEDHNLQAADLEVLLAPFGARLKNSLGRVNYAGRCNIRKHSGIHLVVPGQQGPVTILLMPSEYVNNQRTIRSSRFSGVIVPTPYGSMAVVGEKEEVLDSVVDTVAKKIIWTI